MSGKPRARSKSPSKKRKVNKNVYDVVQFKKLIGKNLVKPCAAVVIDKKLIMDDIKTNKGKILDGSARQLVFGGYLNKGILYIFNGVDKLILLDNISYSDIEKNGVSLDIVVFQYPKMTKNEVIQHIYAKK